MGENVAVFCSVIIAFSPSKASIFVHTTNLTQRVCFSSQFINFLTFKGRKRRQVAQNLQRVAPSFEHVRIDGDKLQLYRSKIAVKLHGVYTGDFGLR